MQFKTKQDFLQWIKNYFEEIKKNSSSKESFSDLYDPSLLKNNELAADMIIDHIKRGKKIVIVGDYDADGIFATFILYSFFRDLQLDFMVDFIIPNRLTEGYGISPKVIDRAANLGAELIVTVDNGISAANAVDYAHSKGMKVIITDHHTVGKTLPCADVIVNPQQEGETFPFINISGATVAWYLTAMLKRKMGVSYSLSKHVDLVGLSVISDVMPVNDINRIFVKYAIKQIQSEYREIYKQIWNDWSRPTVDEKSIAFQLIPMFNATGRLHSAVLAVNLLLIDEQLRKNRDNIQARTEFLNTLINIKAINDERKTKTEWYLSIAEEQIQANRLYEKGAIVVKHPDFHEGIIGIVAGKIAEKYGIPAYVFAYNKEHKLWKGSGRTHPAYHLYEITSLASQYIVGFGGHEGAVGLSILDDNIEKFSELISEVAQKNRRSSFIDAPVVEVLPEWIDEEYGRIREFYAPFGHKFPEPIFKVEAKKQNLKDKYFFERRIGTQNQHSMFFYKTGDHLFKTLFFFYDKKDIPDTFLIEFSKEYNLKNGTFSISHLAREH